MFNSQTKDPLEIYCLFKCVKLLVVVIYLKLNYLPDIPAKIYTISAKEGPKLLQNYDNSNKAAHTEQSVLLNG